ncbi:MAG: hypothetical protein PUP92_39640 [Rhizonema sp. PD38]|nr:hypothetical protein [Rhizonema sp. PD38]
MENPDLLLLDVDFIKAWENFLHYHSQAIQLLTLTTSSTSHSKEFLYTEALQAHTTAIEAYMRMNQLVQRSVKTTVKKKDITPKQIMNWSQELKVRSLKNVARSKKVRLTSLELRTKHLNA